MLQAADRAHTTLYNTADRPVRAAARAPVHGIKMRLVQDTLCRRAQG